MTEIYPHFQQLTQNMEHMIRTRDSTTPPTPPREEEEKQTNKKKTTKEKQTEGYLMRCKRVIRHDVREMVLYTLRTGNVP